VKPSGPRRDGLDRADILAVSRDILERDGKTALTIRRIAEAVGRTQPAVYARFADKDELVAALALDGFEILAGLLERAAERKEPLAAVAAAYVGFANDHPLLYEVMFIEPISLRFASGSATPPALIRSFAALLAATSASCAPSVGRRLEPSRLELVTETLWAALHGIVVLAAHHRLRPGSTLQRQRIQAIVRGARAMLP
jgi:AcrR family transcriptional regulator